MSSHPAHPPPLVPLTFLSVLLQQPGLLPALCLHVDPLHAFPEGIQLHAGVQGLHRHRLRVRAAAPAAAPAPTHPPQRLTRLRLMRSNSWLQPLPVVASQKHWFPGDKGFSAPRPPGPSSCSQPQPNTKLASAWQWARRTTACTSSASDQLHSLIFSSFCRTYTEQPWDAGRQGASPPGGCCCPCHCPVPV